MIDTPVWCKAALSLLPIRKPSLPVLPDNHPEHKPLISYLDQHEIYPGSKVAHFKRLSSTMGIAFTSMVFFDDEPRNIRDVGALGVTCILVRSGMCMADFVKGLNEFQNRSQQSSVMIHWLSGSSNSGTGKRIQDAARATKGNIANEYEDEIEEFAD